MATRIEPRRTTPEDLLARYRATGDPQALGALFDETAPVLYRIALSLCPDAAAAEDALQETFLASLAHLDRHDPARPVTPWLVGILQNEVRMARRRDGRRPDPQRMRVPLDPTAEGASGHSEEVRTAIESLEEPYRSVALLRWRYGLEPQEIAHVRDEAPGTTRSLLHRALDRLRGALRGAPAFFLLPTAGAALETIRARVLAEAATLAPPPAAAGGVPAVGASPAGAFPPAVKVAAAVAACLVAGAAGWWALRPSSSAGDAAAPPTAGSAPAAVVVPAVPGETDPGAVPAGGDAPPRPDAVDPSTISHAPPSTPPEAAPLPAQAGLRPATPTRPPRPEEGSTPPLPPPPGVDVPDPTEAAARAADGKDAPTGGAGAPPAGVPAGPGEDVSAALDRRIGESLEKGVAWLRRAQGSDGSWGRVKGNAAYDGKSPEGTAYDHPAGPTALALYALLKARVPVDDPAIRRGFAALKKLWKPAGSAYETSMTLLAVTATADPFKKSADSADAAAGSRTRLTGEFRGWALRLQDDLLDKRKTAKSQGWRYQVRAAAPGSTPGGEEDLSSTQLAALALLAADRCGLRTPPPVWNDLIAFAMRQQEVDGPPRPRAVVLHPKGPAAGGTVETPRGGAAGTKDRARGFAYVLSDTLAPDEGKPTGGMTACGIGTLEIARYALTLHGDRMDADPAVVEQAIWDGLAWLDFHWSPFENPGKKAMNVYHLGYCYAVERAFDLLGFRRLGTRAWYPDMAAQVVARQTAKGFWDSQTAHEPRAVLDTSFALLVLDRSTVEPGYTPPMTQDGTSPPLEGR